jgi:hypothetical protein
MRRIRAVLGVFVSLLAATAFDAVAGTRGVEVVLRSSEVPGAPVAGTVPLYGRSYALVVGIDAYRNWPRLSNAIKDARLVAVALERHGFEVTLKTDLDADGLDRAFRDFFIEKGEDPEARLFVWFAGHGHTERGEGYLVPADAPRAEAGARFLQKAVPIRNFGTYVRQARAKHVFGVFDSCFAGTIFDTARSLPPAAVTRATTLPVRQFLTSGDAGEKVSDDGTFGKLFVRALEGEEKADANGDGYVTATEMGLFLSDRMVNLRLGQTPRYGKLRDPDWDRGDFVFVLPGAAGDIGTSSATVAAVSVPKVDPPPVALSSTVTPSAPKTSVQGDPHEIFMAALRSGDKQRIHNGLVDALSRTKTFMGEIDAVTADGKQFRYSFFMNISQFDAATGSFKAQLGGNAFEDKNYPSGRGSYGKIIGNGQIVGTSIQFTDGEVAFRAGFDGTNKFIGPFTGKFGPPMGCTGPCYRSSDVKFTFN